MSLKRLFGAITLRTLIIGSIVTGLSFLFPAALGIFIGAGSTILISSVIITIDKCKKYNFINDIPTGDLEYYDLPEQSNYSKFETKVLDVVEELPSKFKNKKDKNKINNDEDILIK